jgi:hypothetical protein
MVKVLTRRGCIRVSSWIELALSATPETADGERAQRWLAFLNHHREVIPAFEFFTVPTSTFRVLYCFFEHQRLRIPHFKTTAQPTGDWIVQQLRKGCLGSARTGIYRSTAMPSSAARRVSC